MKKIYQNIQTKKYMKFEYILKSYNPKLIGERQKLTYHGKFGEYHFHIILWLKKHANLNSRPHDS